MEIITRNNVDKRVFIPRIIMSPSGIDWHSFCILVNFKVRHSTTLGCICHLQSFSMVSYMLLSHRSQAMQTSRFSAARVSMDTCGMWYIQRFTYLYKLYVLTLITTYIFYLLTYDTHLHIYLTNLKQKEEGLYNSLPISIFHAK